MKEGWMQSNSDWSLLTHHETHPDGSGLLDDTVLIHRAWRLTEWYHENENEVNHIEYWTEQSTGDFQECVKRALSTAIIKKNWGNIF